MSEIKYARKVKMKSEYVIAVVGGIVLALIAYWIAEKSSEPKKKHSNLSLQSPVRPKSSNFITNNKDPALDRLIACFAASGGTLKAWMDCKSKIHVRDNAAEVLEKYLIGDEANKSHSLEDDFQRNAALFIRSWKKGQEMSY